LQSEVIPPHTLHQPDETGKRKGKMTWALNQLFHTHQRVFMWKWNWKGCPWPPLTVQAVINSLPDLNHI